MSSPTQRSLAIDPGTTESAIVAKPVISERRRIQIRAALRRYHAKNRLKRNLESQAWRRAHLKERAEYMRGYRQKRPEIFRALERNRVRPVGHKEKFNAYVSQWKKANPDKRLASYQKRRAKQGIAIPASVIASIREAHHGACHYCKNPLDNNGRGHMDHKTPLSRGGLHVAENVCFACSSCNLRKGSKTDAEFNNRN